MASDALYNFSDKADNEDASLKVNMDELFVKKQQQDLNVMNNYNKILSRIHNKIKYVSKQLINDQCCWYVMPEMMIGIPKYNCNDCTAYIINKLRDNGFIVNYTHPNLLFISWKHWVPSYVRNEIKKKNGKNIDEYGNISNKNNDNKKNKNSNNDDYNSLILNNNQMIYTLYEAIKRAENEYRVVSNNCK